MCGARSRLTTVMKGCQPFRGLAFRSRRSGRPQNAADRLVVVLGRIQQPHLAARAAVGRRVRQGETTVGDDSRFEFLIRPAGALPCAIRGRGFRGRFLRRRRESPGRQVGHFRFAVIIGKALVFRLRAFAGAGAAAPAIAMVAGGRVLAFVFRASPALVSGRGRRVVGGLAGYVGLGQLAGVEGAEAGVRQAFRPREDGAAGMLRFFHQASGFL